MSSTKLRTRIFLLELRQYCLFCMVIFWCYVAAFRQLRCGDHRKDGNIGSNVIYRMKSFNKYFYNWKYSLDHILNFLKYLCTEVAKMKYIFLYIYFYVKSVNSPVLVWLRKTFFLIRIISITHRGSHYNFGGIWEHPFKFLKFLF